MPRLTLPAGEYYVVDPCYLLGDVYDKFLPQLVKFTNAKIFTHNKHKFLVVGDFGGDGTYDGHIRTGSKTRKIQVPVDAGMVALIPVALVKEIGTKMPRLLGPAPKVKFTTEATVKIKKTSQKATDSFEVSDGHASVHVDFEMEPRMKLQKNPRLNDYVKQAIENSLYSPKQGPTYFVRPAGSFVVGQTRDKTDANGGLKIAQWLMTLSDWHEVTDVVRNMGAGFGQVRYFQATIPAESEAYEGVLLWGELTPTQKAQVFVQEAHHAANAEELVAYDIPLKRAQLVSIMIGNADNPQEDAPKGKQVVYTWYPGRITPFRKNENLQAQLEAGSLDYYCTVKSVTRPVKANPRKYVQSN